VIEGDPDYNHQELLTIPAARPGRERTRITAPLAEAGYRRCCPWRGGDRFDSLREGLSVTKLLTTSESSFVKPRGLP
jgi:hypothetical protein